MFLFAHGLKGLQRAEEKARLKQLGGPQYRPTVAGPFHGKKAPPVADLEALKAVNRARDEAAVGGRAGFAEAPLEHQLLAVMAGQAYAEKRGRKSRALEAAGYVLDPTRSTAEAALFVPYTGALDEQGVEPMAPTPERPAVLAYRGTVPSNPEDVLTDVALAAGKLKRTPRYVRSLAMARSLQNSVAKNALVLTGHSLGGSLALWAARALGLRAAGFNPGVGADLLPARGRKGQFVVYRTPVDVVSALSVPQDIVENAVSSVTGVDRALDLQTVEGVRGPQVNPLAAHEIAEFGGLRVTDLSVTGRSAIMHDPYWASRALAPGATSLLYSGTNPYGGPV